MSSIFDFLISSDMVISWVGYDIKFDYDALLNCKYRLIWLILIFLDPYMSSSVFMILIFHCLQYYLYWLLYNICMIDTIKNSLIKSWGKGELLTRLIVYCGCIRRFGEAKVATIIRVLLKRLWRDFNGFLHKGNENNLLKRLIKLHVVVCNYPEHLYHCLRGTCRDQAVGEIREKEQS